MTLPRASAGICSTSKNTKASAPANRAYSNDETARRSVNILGLASRSGYVPVELRIARATLPDRLGKYSTSTTRRPLALLTPALTSGAVLGGWQHLKGHEGGRGGCQSASNRRDRLPLPEGRWAFSEPELAGDRAVRLTLAGRHNAVSKICGAFPFPSADTES